MVVVPTLLTGRQRIAAIIEGLELRYLANRDPNLWFGLLTDFGDAAEEHVEGDEALLALAAGGIEELNGKYGNGAHGRFFLFHRPRLYNPQEGCWMGRERKRGKLEDFNALLCGDDRDSLQPDRGRRVAADLDPLRHHAGHRHRPAVGGRLATGGRRRPPAEPPDDGSGRPAPGPRLRDPPAARQHLAAQRRSRAAIPGCWPARWASTPTPAWSRTCTRTCSRRPPSSARASTTWAPSASCWTGASPTTPC